MSDLIKLSAEERSDKMEECLKHIVVTERFAHIWCIKCDQPKGCWKGFIEMAKKALEK